MTGLAIWEYIVAFGGVLGALLAAFKVRPERTNIIVTAAQGAVVVQSGVIDDLREQVEDLRKEVSAHVDQSRQIRLLRGEVETLTDRLEDAIAQRDRLIAENKRLAGRVAHLEAIVRQHGLETNGAA